MEVLPEYTLIRAKSLDEIVEARTAHPDGALIGGGTDLMVNIRRGIVSPPAVIDINGVEELRVVKAWEGGLEIGAGVTLTQIAGDPGIVEHFPAIAQAARSIAGPTQRNMGTLGGNLCLDTRCIFYNQSDWWRSANNHCLKTTGDVCHVAPKSKGVCFATYSGDLAPALLVCGAEVDVVSARGARSMPLADLYIGHARHDDAVAGDGKNFLSLSPGELVTGVRAPSLAGYRSAYDKIRIRRSIEYPVAGVAVALKMAGAELVDLRVAFTGTNPRPVPLEGTADLCGGPVDEPVFDKLDDLVRDQIMAMKTTFTPGHYRRRMASVLAARLVRRLATG